jgi:hypothetical protein
MYSGSKKQQPKNTTSEQGISKNNSNRIIQQFI